MDIKTFNLINNRFKELGLTTSSSEIYFEDEKNLSLAIFSDTPAESERWVIFFTGSRWLFGITPPDSSSCDPVTIDEFLLKDFVRKDVKQFILFNLSLFSE